MAGMWIQGLFIGPLHEVSLFLNELRYLVFNDLFGEEFAESFHLLGLI
jgi:hypothetical protein